jgi:glycine rich protein
MKVRLGLVCTVLCWAMFAGQALGQTVTFFPTGGQQTLAVPAGVSTVHVTAVGGSGGGDGLGTPGGFGARASADLSVSPGQVLYVEVGGNAGSGLGSGAGGFNGGGAGGSGSGGGGGASDVRTSPMVASGSLASRLIVAGGGGGGASGAGGGNAGADGTGAGAGKAGLDTGGGAGGDAPSGETGALPGDAGAIGAGGAGVGVDIGGAGGGGGLFGGGGGTGCTSPMGQMPYYCDDPITFPGGNGGGGSSGFAMGASNTSVSHDTLGVPSITITYSGPPPAKPPAPPSAALIGKSLLAQLVPHGKAARISAIRKHRGYTSPFDALIPGTVTISWDAIRDIRKHGHTVTRTVLVAKGTRKFSAAGKSQLTIRLSSKGRTLFKHAKRLKLTAKGTFKPSGAPAIARQKTFTLHG